MRGATQDQAHSRHRWSLAPPGNGPCSLGTQLWGKAALARAVLTPLSSLLFCRQPASEEKMKPCRV